jgi:hypothetical protein
VFLIDALLYDNLSAIMMPMPRGQIPILLLAASNHRLPRYKAAGAEITRPFRSRGKCAGTSARTVFLRVKLGTTGLRPNSDFVFGGIWRLMNANQ